MGSLRSRKNTPDCASYAGLRLKLNPGSDLSSLLFVFTPKNRLESCFLPLRLFDQASFDCLDGYPHAFHLTTFQADTNALQVWPKTPTCVFNKASANATTFFRKTFSRDTTSFYRAFTSDCTDTGHSYF